MVLAPKGRVRWRWGGGEGASHGRPQQAQRPGQRRRWLEDARQPWLDRLGEARQQRSLKGAQGAGAMAGNGGRTGPVGSLLLDWG